ncbi:hypothetical protein ACJMK2_014651 [Sinanodonta woodiana]|uniref:Uncharacterized protein n=1 Tax=Sinanodonta woodiana TaxID=1069815 RepID=A0ABD3V1A3_SINWO
MNKRPLNVYIWERRHDNSFSFGHASFSLSDGTYISWWPSSDSNLLSKAFGTTGTYTRSLEEDIELQDKRQPDAVFTLTSCVDEAAIHRWWKSFKTGSSYSGIKQNCCSVVFQALVNGSVLHLFPDNERSYWESVSVWRQSYLNDFLTALCLHIEEHEKRKRERFIDSICLIVLVGLLGLVLSKTLTFIIGIFYSRT